MLIWPSCIRSITFFIKDYDPIHHKNNIEYILYYTVKFFYVA